MLPSTLDEKAAAMRTKNLDLAIQQIEKDYGSEAIRRLGDATVSAVEVIPTGNILIDRALGLEVFLAGESLRFSVRKAPARPLSRSQ